MAKKWHQLEKLDHKALKKLQLEREKALKAQAEAAEKKKKIIIASLVFLLFVFVVSFYKIIRARSAELERQKVRASLMYTELEEFAGEVSHRHIGIWDPLTENFGFDQEYSFRTSQDGSLTLTLQLGNQIFLSSKSEITVFPPELSQKDDVVERQIVLLIDGEMTCSMAIQGKDALFIEVGGVVIKGSSGLFKVIFDDQRQTGEVVVKNGNVDIYRKDSGDEPIRVSGFYKSIFNHGQVEQPVQASVIQYNW